MNALVNEYIGINSKAFSEINADFDEMLQKLFARMEKVGSQEGEITLKVSVTMKDEIVDDGEHPPRNVSKPVIEHKVTTSVPMKEDTKGKNDTGMELVYDETEGRYVLRPVRTAQCSFYDDYQQDDSWGGVQGDSKGASGQVPMLEGMSRLLPGGSADVIDIEPPDEDGYPYDDPNA